MKFNNKYNILYEKFNIQGLISDNFPYIMDLLLVFYIRFLLSYDPSSELTFEKIIDNSYYILDQKMNIL